MTTTMRAGEIAAQVGGQLAGDADLEIGGIAGLREAQPGDITFLANPKYAAWLATTRASAVLVAADFDGEAACALIRVKDPDAAFGQVATHFTPPPPAYPPGIHPSAIVAEDAEIGEEVHVGPCCVVQAGARIGPRTVLVGQVYVGHRCTLGADNFIHPHVTIREHGVLGDRVIIHSSAVIGSDGFGYSVDDKGVRTKIPQRGHVAIGDDAEVGAAVTIDRARFGCTRIGRGVKIDNLCQIAHNVVIGDHAVLVSQVGISGSSVIGRHVVLAGQAGVAGHLVVGDGVIAEGRSGITKDVPAGQVVYGFPAAPREQAARVHAHVQRLPRLKEKVRTLEQRIAELEARLQDSGSSAPG